MNRKLQARKKTTSRVTKNQAAAINGQYLGEEPIVSQFDRIALARAFSWYNYMKETKDARQYLVTYLTERDRKKEARAIKKVADNAFPLTAGWIARILNNGGQVDDYSVKFIDNAIQRAMKTIAPAPKKVKKVVERQSVQENIREKVYHLTDQIEQKLDAEQDPDAYQLLTNNQVSAVIANKVKAHFDPIVEEISAAKNGDKEVLEGYRHLTKKALTALYKRYQALADDLEKYCSGAKRTRRTKKKKPKSIVKKTQNIKYMKRDDTLKLVSADPARIVGASEVWLFNKTFSRLTVLRAATRDGLDLKGTTVIGFDPEHSDAKRIGRNQDKILDRVANGGKRVLKRVMTEVKAKSQKISGRLSDNTLIVRVEK